MNCTIGSFAQITQRPTVGGNVCVDINLIQYPGRSGRLHKRFYRSNPINDCAKWGQSPQGRIIINKFETYYLGQMLVSHYRQAISDGEITKEQAQEIRNKLDNKYGHPGTYIDRYWQSDAAKELDRLTQNNKYYLTDVWL